MKKNAVNKSGFTLIELLIVVLIIGILSATALPMYRKSVEKSRVTDALTTMGAVAKSEHAWYLEHSNYTDDFANLDIDLIDADGNKADGESYETVNYTFTLQDTAIRADRNNGEYTLYKLYEDGNIYCLPQDHYICEQYDWGMNENSCKRMEGVWHNGSSSCYNSQKERCEQEYSENLWQGDYCGYVNTGGQELTEGMECRNADNYYGCGYSKIYEGAVCKGNYGGCLSASIYNGGKCEASGRNNGCQDVIIYSGGVCVANATGGCTFAYMRGGICVGNKENSCNGLNANLNGGSGICYANKENTCKGSYNSNGSTCCCGEYCPNNAPKCEDFDKYCDPQYMN